MPLRSIFDAEFGIHAANPAGFNPNIRKIDFVVRMHCQFRCVT